MITTYKSKTFDAIQDINVLKDQLGSVLKEISAFGSRIEETKALQLHADEYGFARSFSYEERLRDLKQKLQPGREPAKPVIFLTRMVVESLSRGPMSEKDIKTIVLERCKDLGIKSSNRGLIAGTGMDVATVCSVLAALGAIEATAPPDPKADPPPLHLTNISTSADSNTSTINPTPETITGLGAGVYSALTERWGARLTEYIEDALKSKAAALLESSNTDAAGGTTSVGGMGSGVGSVGSSGNKNVNVFSNNTSANTSAGVTPSASCSNIASLALGTAAYTNTSNTTTNISNVNNSTIAAPHTTIHNTPISVGGVQANTTAANPTNSTNLPAGTTTNTITNNTMANNTSTSNTTANTTAVMSNTARLIAEYHSRNGTDPNTINNSNTSSTSTMGSANTTLPAYNNTKSVQKPIQNYFSPAGVSSGVNGSVGGNGVVGGVHSVHNPHTTAPGIIVNSTMPNTVYPTNNTLPTTSINSSVVNSTAAVPSIGYRAPLAPDTPAVDTLNTSTTSSNNTNSNNTNSNTTAHSIPHPTPVPYSAPVYPITVPLYTTLPQTLPPYTSSNPATTPATVGFLSVTHPSTRLVLPGMSADGALSHSVSANSIGGVGGVGAVGSSIGINNGNNSGGVVGGVLHGSSGQYGGPVNNGMQPVGLPFPTSTINTVYPITTAMSSTINTNYPIGGPIAPLGNVNSSLPMHHNTTTHPANTAHAIHNSAYPAHAANTTHPASVPGKAKASKPPKPPVEKKLSKKAAAAAAKLLDATAAAASIASNSSAVSGNSNGVLVSGSASSSVAGTTTAANSNKARRGPSALRVWKLREEFVLLDVSSSGDVKPSIHNTNNGNSTMVNAAVSLLLDPSQLHSSASAHYALSSQLELEERLLRRIAGQCNIPLQASSYRAGTAALSGLAGGEKPVSRVYSAYKYNASSTAAPVVAEEVYAEVEPSYAVYDDTSALTASYLLDKIRRSKRQKGECLYGTVSLPYASSNSVRSAAAASVGVYSAAHVHALSAVCSKTNDFYWSGSTGRATNKNKKPPASSTSKGANDPITMAQYARNVHTGAGGSSVVLSSCSNGSSITTHTLRRYAQPLELTNAHLPMLDVSNKTVFAAATGGAHNTNASNTATNNGSVVLSIPDLALNTREIAWSEIAAEFTVLAAPTEEGSIGFGYSASTAALDTVVNVANSTVKSEKKRKYLNNEGSSNKGKSAAGSNSGTSAASLAMEVLAPQFVEIVPVTVTVAQMKAQQLAPPSSASADSDSEDTSDEACLSRHEATLQSMRDKWTRLQQLKNDALYGVGGAPEVKSTYRGGGGYGGYFNRASTTGGTGVELSPLGSPLGVDGKNNFQNLSPRKRGLASAHAKRRGRPPKNAKFHNNNLLSAIPAAVDNGSSMEVDE